MGPGASKAREYSLARRGHRNRRWIGRIPFPVPAHLSTGGPAGPRISGRSCGRIPLWHRVAHKRCTNFPCNQHVGTWLFLLRYNEGCRTVGEPPPQGQPRPRASRRARAHDPPPGSPWNRTRRARSRSCRSSCETSRATGASGGSGADRQHRGLCNPATSTNASGPNGVPCCGFPNVARLRSHPK